jgi:hypothetical protein
MHLHVIFWFGSIRTREPIPLTGHFRAGAHATEFDAYFLADLEDGQLPEKYLCDGIEG